MQRTRDHGLDPLAKILPKEMKYIYRGVDIMVTVTLALDQYQVAVESYLRGLAVDAGLLKALWSEDELVGTRVKPSTKIAQAWQTP